MNEEFLNNLITNYHISPPLMAKKEQINSELKVHPEYIQGMEFEVAYFSPDRRSNNIHVFIDETWDASTKAKANKIYIEVFRNNGVNLIS